MLKPVSRLNVKIAPATVQAAKPAQPARPLCSVRQIRRTAQINSSGKIAITRRLCQNQMARASTRFTAARVRGEIGADVAVCWNCDTVLLTGSSSSTVDAEPGDYDGALAHVANIAVVAVCAVDVAFRKCASSGAAT